MAQNQMMTKVNRFQARHTIYKGEVGVESDETLASSPLECRYRSFLLTGGGTLLWETSGDLGTFSWSETLRVEAPTIGYAMTVAAASVSNVDKGHGIKINVPYLDVDDVDPAGLWAYPGDKAVSIVEMTTTPDEEESVFVIGFYGQDGNLYLCNGQVLEDGVPNILGGNLATGRSIIEADGNSSGGVWADVGYLYLPDRCRLHVSLNGVEQIPYSATVPTPDGYSSVWATSQYKEVEGTRSGHSATAFSGLEWNTAFNPEIGEWVIVTILPPSLPAGGESAEPGLDGAYDDRSYITLHFDEDTDSQAPVTLKELLEGAAFTGTPRTLSAGYEVNAFGVQRTINHPESAYREKFAGGLLSSGDFYGCGNWFYRPKDWTTIENELANTTYGTNRDVGLFFQGMGVSPATTPTGKLVTAFVPWSRLASKTIGNLPAVREGGILPFMDGGTSLCGQVSQNIHGELATGWGKDFIRWHVFEIALDSAGPFPEDHDVVTIGPFSLDPAIIDPGIQFLGGTVSVGKDITPTSVYYYFSHMNPSLSVVGENPDEFKAWLEYQSEGGEYDLNIIYGRNLDGNLARFTLFFSAEYASEDEI